ncbi:hypothetical protein BGZ89_004594, partial [Linnemannia elongata]
MLYANKQPSSLRKTASKNSTKKLQQQLSRHAQGSGGTHLSPSSGAVGAAGTSRSSSKRVSWTGPRVHSDDEDDDYGGGFENCEVYGSEREDGGGSGGRRGGGEESVESRILDAVGQLGEKRS